MARAERPLSPHLQIFRWYFTMALSIAHRATGIALALGLVLLTWWLLALAHGPDAFALVQAVLGSWIGVLVLFLYTFVLFYHMGNGVRHLVWDFGYGFDVDVARRSGSARCLASVGIGPDLSGCLAHKTVPKGKPTRCDQEICPLSDPERTNSEHQMGADRTIP
jgi:succinate dehydrogenase / fumarate reductase, cytochrome b subunit